MVSGRLHLTAHLRRLSVPTLVVHGDRDLVPVAVAHHVAGAIRGSRLVVLDDCGHFAFIEHPDLVRSCISDLVGP